MASPRRERAEAAENEAAARMVSVTGSRVSFPVPLPSLSLTAHLAAGF